MNKTVVLENTKRSVKRVVRLLSGQTMKSRKEEARRAEKLARLERIRTRYVELYESVDIDDHIIFYESMSGARMMDNPYAIFKQVYNDQRFKDFTHVWSVNSPSTVSEEYRSKDNVVIVSRGTEDYLHYLVSAKYLICNSAFPDYFTRKPGQEYLNTWHGIAYKGVGRDSGPLGAAGSVRNMLQATHILTPCNFMTEKTLDAYSIRGIYTGRMAEVGYPRIDTTINASVADKQRVKRALGIKPNKKTVLYAPTWRGTKGNGKFDTTQLKRDLTALSKIDANIIFMGHHIMLKHVKGFDFGDIIIPPSSTNTNELLSVTDILITDYSSIFFDFLVTNRPIIHYVYDYAEYARERGLSLSLDELPGVVAHTTKDLVQATTQALKGYTPTDRYITARNRFCPHEDGHSARRAVEWFFFNKTKGIDIVPKRKEKSIVFWGGDFLGDLSKLDNFFDKLETYATQGKNVSLVVGRSRTKENVHAMSRIRKLDQSIKIIPRAGRISLTEKEKAARYAIEAQNSKKKDARDLYDRAFHREYRRILGDAVFSGVEVFDTSRFWSKLMEYALAKS